MLASQGAAAFTLWTGQPAPLELMREKLAEGLAANGATAGGGERVFGETEPGAPEAETDGEVEAAGEPGA